MLTIYYGEDCIGEYALDTDRILTDKERKLIDQSYENQKKGMLTSISQFKKEMGI